MRIDIVSIFPGYLEPLRLSLVGKAIEAGTVQLRVHDLRDWTHDRHRTVDDTPYGGGAGMVMKPQPWGEALDALVGSQHPRLVVLSPSGATFTQSVAQELAAESHLILACGRYEGIDARVVEDARQRLRVDELSIGDYVLAGGEAAALVVVEAVVRLLPGVIGNPESLTEESHSPAHDGLLEYPLYTKPPVWRGLAVPDVLLSGHHGKVGQWRRDQAIARTRDLRPDLLPAEPRSPDSVDPVVSRAADSDVGELWTLQRAAYLSEAHRYGTLDIPPLTETLPQLRDALAQGVVLVARLGGRLVASVRGVLEADGSWYIGRLLVAPDLQGRGLGTRLMDAIESLAPTGSHTARLWTGALTESNISFYAHRGYALQEQTKIHGDIPVVVMVKQLS